MKNILWILLLLFIPNIGLASISPTNNETSECSAWFSWEPFGGANTVIAFSNESQGDFNTWMWDFGDGFTSPVFSPAHEFSDYGTYYVCLTIEGDSCNDIFCDTIIVTPSCEPDFEFTYVPTTPMHVQFTDLSGTPPDAWFWDFGDGTTSTQQNPVHPYPIPGTYQVCLTITIENGISCTDSICKFIVIPDSVNCEAAYTYNIDPSNPLEITFSDNSVGNITDWTWDFGDGTTSHEPSPVHEYAEPAEYLVCLNVENSDTNQHCFHFICKTIDLADTIICLSDFTFTVDSSSNVMYRHYFTDMSTGNPDGWLWNFGDGNTSNEQHPVHVYDEAGIYEVCLESWNSNQAGCSDSYCQLLQTTSYHQLGGQAFIGEYPINNPYPTGDTGVAILYRQRSDLSVVAVDTNTFHQLGYYAFSDMMELPYTMRIGLTPGSANYHNFIPTYYPEGMTWDQAGSIMLSEDMFEMHTSMIPVVGVENGIGTIRGRVVLGERKGVEAHHSFHDIPVILCDQNNLPLDWITTNEFGQFEFINIAFGSYKLYADLAGIYTISEQVVLEDGYPVVDTIRIEMFTENPLSIPEAPDEIISINGLYPNPVKDLFNVELTAERDMELQLNIYNITGQLLQSNRQYISKGINILQVESKNMPPGMYLLRLGANGMHHILQKKFIKN